MQPFQPTYETPQAASYPTTFSQTGELDFHSLVIQPIEAMLAQLVGFIPNLLAALYILIFGWIIAHLIKIVTSRFLTAIRFDKIAEKIGLSELLDEGEQKITASRWFGVLAFWLTILVSFVIALDYLRLEIASQRLDQVIYLIGSSLAAILVLTLGMFLSELIARLVRTTAKNLHVPRPEIHANIIRWVVLIFTLMVTLAQFQIPGDFVLVALGVVFATLCLTFILAFGIGGCQWAAKVLDKLGQ